MAEKAKNEKKEGFLKRVAHRFVKGCKDMKGEIKKVVWPSKKQIINNTAVVLACCIIVGVFMMKGVLKVDWSDMETAIPCFLTIAMMPFAYSIADGIGFGIISYTLIKLARGKAKEVPVLMYILSALFILSYILLATTAA